MKTLMLHKKLMAIKIMMLTIVSLLLFSLVACGLEQKENFGMYLADTGELVLSERHVKAYYNDDNTLELNDSGIKRWNSYMEYEDIPKLAKCLFARDFILKIEEKEVCTGKFWSMVSSASYSGIVILDSLFPLDSDHNRLWIKSGYPGISGNLDPLISSELIRFFGEHNKLISR